MAAHPHAASRDHAAKVQSQNKYPHPHTLRDPATWTQSPQEAILNRGPQRSRALPSLPQDIL